MSRIKILSDTDESEDELIYSRTFTSEESKSRNRLHLLISLSAIGGFLFGYDTGIVSSALVLIRKEFGISDFMHELIVSSAILGALIFALVGAYFSDKYGRKPVILASSVLFTIGSFIMGLAPGPKSLVLGENLIII